MQPYEQLEEKIAEWSQRKFAVVCNSGTAALHLALESLNLPPGSEVVLPDFTMVACARAVMLAGLIPVFVDCDENGLMDMRILKRVVKKQTRVIMAVHIYGRRCDMDAIHDIAKPMTYVIEDLAEAHGITPHVKTHAACWSFYKNKVIAGEEGGAIAYHNVLMAQHARCLRSLGFTEAHDFTHIPRGHNYRLANTLAELILKSFDAFPANLQQRKHSESVCNLYCPREWRTSSRDVPWVYDIKCGSQKVAQLKAVGIDARHSFKPMHLLEEFKDFAYFGDSVGRDLHKELIYLPLPMTEPDIRRAFDLLKRG